MENFKTPFFKNKYQDIVILASGIRLYIALRIKTDHKKPISRKTYIKSYQSGTFFLYLAGLHWPLESKRLICYEN